VGIDAKKFKFKAGSPLHKLQECLKTRRITLMDALKLISASSMKNDMPEVNIGDTVKVHCKIKEGDKERIQIFEGTVIAKKHGGVQETFTVRRVAHGCGIERVFPVHSPNVVKVEVVRSGKVRRAKLYYLRDRVGKAAKIKQKIK
jgi:large subunit ribosomal protein L19